MTKSPKDWSPEEEKLARALRALGAAVKSKEGFLETLAALKEMAKDAAESADEARDREETRFWDRATAALDDAIKKLLVR